MRQKTAYTWWLMPALVPLALSGEVNASSDSLEISVQVLPTVVIDSEVTFQFDTALLNNTDDGVNTNDIQSFDLIMDEAMVEIQAR